MNLIKDIFNCIDKYGTIVMGIFVFIGLILSIIGVCVEKKRTGHSWVGQGYGED